MIITDRIDYEALDTKQLTFDIAVYDAGVPQKSAMASVVVNVQNLNDESPVFEQPEGYSASGKNENFFFRIFNFTKFSTLFQLWKIHLLEPQ